MCFRNYPILLFEQSIRRIETGEHVSEHVDPDDFIAMRKLAMKRRKMTLGRIIKEGFKGHFGRIYRKLRRSKLPQNHVILQYFEENGLFVEENGQIEEDNENKGSSRKSSLSSLPSLKQQK